jgi:tRNA dimethylallyltransferase
MKQIPLVIIAGPTASGKTALALRLADERRLEVISADSRQVYRGMDIGTAKPSGEEMAKVRHHMIDIVDPDEEFTAADFALQGRQVAEEIHRRGALPLVVGGTGLYIRTLTEGLVQTPAADPALRRRLLEREAKEGEGTLHRELHKADPALAARLFPRDLVRIVRGLEVWEVTGERLSELQGKHAFGERPFRLLWIGLGPERGELYRRIDQRVEQMVSNGLVDETQSLLLRGYAPQCKGLRTIGYQETIRHLRGEIALEEMILLIQQNTRRYAKRQFTWFTKIKEMFWLDSLEESDKIPALIENFMRDQRSGHG